MSVNWTADGQYVGPVPPGGFQATVSPVFRRFEEYSAQYGQGPPGISYRQIFETQRCCVVDCLLYRNASGLLVGILNHFPNGRFPFIQAGYIMLTVHEDYQNRGIGVRLIKEAGRRWNVNLADQQMTEPAAALANRFVARTRRVARDNLTYVNLRE